MLTGYLQDLNEFLKNMRGGSDSKLARTLVRTIFRPFLNAVLAKQFSTIVTFHRVNRDFKTYSTNKGVFQFFVHHAIMYTSDVISSLVITLIILVSQVKQLFLLSPSLFLFCLNIPFRQTWMGYIPSRVTYISSVW
jgi:hypothetical protein